MQEHIVAVFDSEGPAAAAERALRAEGIPTSAIRRYSSGAGATTRVETSSATTESGSSGGFWSWLLGEDAPKRPDYDQEMDYYERRARAGNTILSVTVADDSKIHRVMETIESHHPVEIDERTEESGRVDTGVAATTVGSSFSSSDTARTNLTGTPGSTTTSAASTSGMTGQEETIPLAEEEIEIGKRTVDRGTTRIRRYVVETPVERQVSLHGERVTVERRAVDTSSAPGAGAFEERVVEVRETEEVPVVQKTAHIAEEVVVHREDTSRTETVRDTVRREEVEVIPDQPGTTKPKV